jgi:excisionase family DNA binding protein
VSGMTTPQLLTAEQLAKRWQVPPSHVYRLTREGRIPVVKLGRYYRYRPEAIDHFEMQDLDERRDRHGRGVPRSDLTRSRRAR